MISQTSTPTMSASSTCDLEVLGERSAVTVSYPNIKEKHNTRYQTSLDRTRANAGNRRSRLPLSTDTTLTRSPAKCGLRIMNVTAPFWYAQVSWWSYQITLAGYDCRISALYEGVLQALQESNFSQSYLQQPSSSPFLPVMFGHGSSFLIASVVLSSFSVFVAGGSLNPFEDDPEPTPPPKPSPGPKTYVCPKDHGATYSSYERTHLIQHHCS